MKTLLLIIIIILLLIIYYLLYKKINCIKKVEKKAFHEKKAKNNFHKQKTVWTKWGSNSRLRRDADLNRTP